MSNPWHKLSKKQLITLVRQQAEQIEQLTTHVAQLTTHVAQLTAQVSQLQEQVAGLKKDSSNSSKPPSSDIVKPPPRSPRPRGSKGKRKIGGQPGHAKHERSAYTPEQLDATWDYTLDECPTCGGALQNSSREPRIIQQVELVEKPVRIEGHRASAHWCPHCRKVHWASSRK